MLEGMAGKCDDHEGQLEPALMKVVKALIFDHQPLPELDALPLAQLRLLWTVYYLDDATMKTFSDRLYVSQSTVTQLAERLVKRGLIERNHDLHDRRVVRLTVSNSARELLDAAAERQHQIISRVWDRLDDRQQSSVLEALDTLLKAVQEVKREDHSLQSDSGLLCAEGSVSQIENSQPVVDLLSRRIRGSGKN